MSPKLASHTLPSAYCEQPVTEKTWINTHRICQTLQNTLWNGDIYHFFTYTMPPKLNLPIKSFWTFWSLSFILLTFFCILSPFIFSTFLTHFWSLLISWIRLHNVSSQMSLFFSFKICYQSWKFNSPKFFFLITISVLITLYHMHTHVHNLAVVYVAHFQWKIYSILSVINQYNLFTIL